MSEVFDQVVRSAVGKFASISPFLEEGKLGIVARDVSHNEEAVEDILDPEDAEQLTLGDKTVVVLFGVFDSDEEEDVAQDLVDRLGDNYIREEDLEQVNL